MKGEIDGLFYRYKTNGGFEYVADLMIGPRAIAAALRQSSKAVFATHPGDSGTLWLLEPMDEPTPRTAGRRARRLSSISPWRCSGASNMFGIRPAPRDRRATPSPHFFQPRLRPARRRSDQELESRSARHLGRHRPFFDCRARAGRAFRPLSPARRAHGEQRGSSSATTTRPSSPATLSGMGEAAFVPMADVPDFFWKPRVAKQGLRAGRPRGRIISPTWISRIGDDKTLLALCEDPANIDPGIWDAFYDSASPIS